MPLLCPRGIYWHLLPTLQGHQPRSWLAAAHAVGTNRHSQPGTAAARADIQLGTARCCWRRCPGRAQHLRCPAGTRSSPPVPALSPRLLRCPSAAAGTSGRAGPADERETSAPTPCQEYLPAGCVLRGHGCSYISCCAEMGPQHGWGPHPALSPAPSAPGAVPVAALPWHGRTHNVPKAVRPGSFWLLWVTNRAQIDGVRGCPGRSRAAHPRAVKR